MPGNPILEETIKDLSEQFEFQENNLKLEMHPSDENFVLNEAKRVLTDRIQDMMENNFEKLSNLLYRIDVNPTKVNECFTNSKLWDIPSELAKLIIERQMEKVKTRNYYRSQNNIIE